MNRRLKSFAIGGFVVPLFALAAWLYRHRPEPLPVLHLADGSEMRLQDVGWSEKPMIRFEPALWSAFKGIVPTRWRAVLGEPAGAVWHPDDDGLTLGFTRVRLAGNSGVRCQLQHLGGDGMDPPVSFMGFSAGTQVIATYQFSHISWRDERLRFRLRDGTNDLEFSVPNPRRGEVFPQWTPEALPQSRTVDEFEFTLTALKEVDLPERSEAPVWAPELGIRRAGTDVTGWFSVRHEFVDPTGNRSNQRLASTEPVWRVRVMAVPSLDFPFPDAAISVRHTGPVPGPGEIRLLPAATEVANLGLGPVWLSGPGQYEFRHGTNAWASAEAGPLKERLNPRPQGGVRFSTPGPLLWWRSEVPVADRREEPPRNWRARVRRADGTPVELKPLLEPHGEEAQLEDLPNRTGYRQHQLTRWQLPVELVGETITVEVICLNLRQAEFNVAAPPPQHSQTESKAGSRAAATPGAVP